jgi:hypothetical protein
LTIPAHKEPCFLCGHEGSLLRSHLYIRDDIRPAERVNGLSSDRRFHEAPRSSCRVFGERELSRTSLRYCVRDDGWCLLLVMT